MLDLDKIKFRSGNANLGKLFDDAAGEYPQSIYDNNVIYPNLGQHYGNFGPILDGFMSVSANTNSKIINFTINSLLTTPKNNIRENPDEYYKLYNIGYNNLVSLLANGYFKDGEKLDLNSEYVDLNKFMVNIYTTAGPYPIDISLMVKDAGIDLILRNSFGCSMSFDGFPIRQQSYNPAISNKDLPKENPGIISLNFYHAILTVNLEYVTALFMTACNNKWDDSNISDFLDIIKSYSLLDQPLSDSKIEAYRIQSIGFYSQFENSFRTLLSKLKIQELEEKREDKNSTVTSGSKPTVLLDEKAKDIVDERLIIRGDVALNIFDQPNANNILSVLDVLRDESNFVIKNDINTLRITAQSNSTIVGEMAIDKAIKNLSTSDRDGLVDRLWKKLKEIIKDLGRIFINIKKSFGGDGFKIINLLTGQTFSVPSFNIPEVPPKPQKLFIDLLVNTINVVIEALNILLHILEGVIVIVADIIINSVQLIVSVFGELFTDLGKIDFNPLHSDVIKKLSSGLDGNEQNTSEVNDMVNTANSGHKSVVDKTKEIINKDAEAARNNVDKFIKKAESVLKIPEYIKKLIEKTDLEQKYKDEDTKITATQGTRGYRNNNPGNLEVIPGGWVGQVGIDSTANGNNFAIFDTPENGIRALMQNIISKVARNFTVSKGPYSGQTITATNLEKLGVIWDAKQDIQYGKDLATYLSGIFDSPVNAKDDNFGILENISAVAKAISNNENGSVIFDEGIYDNVASFNVIENRIASLQNGASV